MGYKRSYGFLGDAHYLNLSSAGMGQQVILFGRSGYRIRGDELTHDVWGIGFGVRCHVWPIGVRGRSVRLPIRTAWRSVRVDSTVMLTVILIQQASLQETWRSTSGERLTHALLLWLSSFDECFMGLPPPRLERTG